MKWPTRNAQREHHQCDDNATLVLLLPAPNVVGRSVAQVVATGVMRGIRWSGVSSGDEHQAVIIRARKPLRLREGNEIDYAEELG